MFVVKADVTTLDCDAWLCPTDRSFSVTRGFGAAVGLPCGGNLRGLRWGDRRAVAFPEHPESAPLIVLGEVGQVVATGPDEVAALITRLLPVIGDFVDVALSCCQADTRRPLRLALPLIGMGQGGLSGAKGETIKPLLTELSRYAETHHVDFVLCTGNDLAWSAIQSARSSHDWNLSAEEQLLARRLAAEARADRLVLFVGAGVSRDAGLPDWRELLSQLHPQGLSEPEQKQLDDLDLRDQATLIEQNLGGRKQLIEKIAEVISRSRHIGLTHALLASLGVGQAITTNYDSLFELACTQRGHTVDQDITVLPYGRVVEGRPWLLKLHGSIDHRDHHDHIVLTRSDYMSLARERSALFGIVQALLVTKHLLFVGDSLSDDDFHQLVDEIRIATASSNTEADTRLGTVLMTSHWPLAGMWNDLLHIQEVGEGDSATRCRHLQIFLDYVAHLSTPHDAHLLDDSFAGLLDTDEEQIAAGLRTVHQVVQQVLARSPNHPTATAVHKMLDNLGAPPSTPRPQPAPRRTAK